MILQEVDFDAIIALGGDGTMLKASNIAIQSNVPIICINFGTLGYMSGLENSEIDMLSALKTGFSTEKRMLLDIEVERNADIIAHATALNEAVVSRRYDEDIASIGLKCDGVTVCDYRADGLIIATPTGSTAYSLSVGGPIMVPHCNTIAITPVAPHSLNVRPIVICDDWELTLDVESRSHNFLVAVDGRSESCKETTRLTICKADYSIKVVKRYNHIFFDALRNKMMWGADIR